MVKVLSIIGTRPEVIKTAILHKLLLENENFELKICSTGQHKEIFDEALSLFQLSADVFLDHGVAHLPLAQRVTELTASLDTQMQLWQPDLCIIQGDTLSGYSSAQAAFMNKIPVAHIEAGLRSHDMNDPYPEEMYRHFIDSISELLFAPTNLSKQNLLHEHIDSSKVFVTGNTAIDAIQYALDQIQASKFESDNKWTQIITQSKALGRTPCLLTLHRRENWGDKFQMILIELEQLAEKFNLRFFYPLHPNPDIHSWVRQLQLIHVKIMPALDYFNFIAVLKNSELVFSDSGGLQEECAYLNKPVIVMRDKTERPEGLTHGSAVLWKNFNAELIEQYKKTALNAPSDIYGDGSASQKIIQILEDRFLTPNS